MNVHLDTLRHKCTSTKNTIISELKSLEEAANTEITNSVTSHKRQIQTLENQLKELDVQLQIANIEIAHLSVANLRRKNTKKRAMR